MDHLSGRALITGATSGMGLVFARELARRGNDLVLVARNGERLNATSAELATLGAKTSVLVADIATDKGLDTVKKRLLDSSSPIDIFINNAGSGLYSRLAVINFDPIRYGAELMALAPMELGGAAASVMKERGHGTIVTTTSVGALIPGGSYSAVKAMVKVWSDSLALELQGTGVLATSFVPGWVRTEFHERTGVSTSSIPSWLWLDAERAVAECLAEVAAGKTLSIPSKRFKVIAFLAQHAPRAAVGAVVKKLNKGRR